MSITTTLRDVRAGTCEVASLLLTDTLLARFQSQCPDLDFFYPDERLPGTVRRRVYVRKPAAAEATR